MVNKQFWATVFTLSGTIIGAGILGLPYVFSQSGLLIGLFWLLVLGGVILFTSLCLGEISLRTKKKHHLLGYAERYLGKSGKWVMFFAAVFGIYSALIAYLIGEGESFSMLITGSLNYSVYFAIGFWLLMTILLRKGLKGLKRVETWGILAIIIITILIVIWYSPQVNIENLYFNDINNFFLPFGVVLFALLGFMSVPELRMEIKGQEKLFKKAIIFGTILPVILYILFSLIFVGVLGKEINEVATLSFGGLVIVLGIFTMLTSYFVLSFVLKDILIYDLGLHKKTNFFLVSVVPLAIYLLFNYFNWLSFVSILGIGGVVSGGLQGVLVLLMNKNSKKKGDRKPEFSIWINWFVIVLLSLVYVLGVIIELAL